MSRNIDSTMAAALPDGAIWIAFLAILTFRSATRYVWTGPGDLVYGGNTYTGVGSLGSLGDIAGGIDVQAQGTSVTLSGIDPVYLDESMTDIQVGAPAKIMFALMTKTMAIVGVPYLLYGGTIDVPTVSMVVPKDDESMPTCSISLKIENRMIDLQRAQMQRYTAADQRLRFPTDSAFNWVEILNDAAFKEGMA